MDWLSNVLAPCVQTSNVIVGGDFNIHAKFLGSDDNDSAASRLEGLITSLEPDGRLLNDGSYTRFGWPDSSAVHRPSAIDVTVCINSNQVRFRNWRTGEMGSSDHVRIYFELLYAVEPSSCSATPTFRVNSKKFDAATLNQFQQDINSNLVARGMTCARVWCRDVNRDSKRLSDVLLNSAIRFKLVTRVKTSSSATTNHKLRNFGWDPNCSDLRDE